MFGIMEVVINMKNIFFVEGIPGSGKSTFARRIRDVLVEQGKAVELYNEGDLHPIDLAWCSIMDENQFNSHIETYSKYKNQIISLSRKWKNQIITAYTKVKVDDNDVVLYRDFEKYEIYRTEDFEYFKVTHRELWSEFSDRYDESKYYVFECVFFQNHINELILKFNCSKEEIVSYFKELSLSMVSLGATLLYLSPIDVKKTLDKTIEERRSDNPVYSDWIDLVYNYLENTNYGKKLGYIGYDGCIKYFQNRLLIELDVLKALEINSYVFEIDVNYDEVFEQIKKAIR